MALAAIGLAAAGLLLYATRAWGLGVTYDSVVYVQASHDLSSISLPQPNDHGGEPLYWWAPVYPLALKLVGGGYDGARLLNAFLLLTGVILIGLSPGSLSVAEPGSSPVRSTHSPRPCSPPT